jgi:hypothetical protein
MIYAYFTADAMVSGGMLPQPTRAMEAFGMVDGLMKGFPDLKYEVGQFTVNGNQATVHVQLSGTNTGQMNLPLPGMPVIPVTGKRASVPDTFIVTVQGDKVSHLQIDSPASGGLQGLLSQLGVKMPGM